MKNIINLSIAAGLMCFASVKAETTEAIPFSWQHKDASIPGSYRYGLKVECSVTKGKGTVCIVRAKKPDATIVLAANPTKSAQIAAKELNHYVERMTGVRLPVVTDESRPFKGPKVLVGESRLTTALGLKSSDFEEQEYCIRTYGDMLVLMGHDEPEYGVIDYENSGLWDGFNWVCDWSLRPDTAKQFGSVYAVDTLLQKVCGVRWYLPGDIGEVCPQKEALVVADLDLKLKPWTKWRTIGPLNVNVLDYFHFPGSGKERKYVNRRDINLWLLRMKILGGEAYNANHSLIAEWFQKRLPDNKDILAKGYDHPTQLCLNSKDLVDITCKDADDYFAGSANHERSYGDYFCVMPHDTGHYCRCPQCQAVIKRRETARGYGSFWTDAVSNYTWGFVNEIAKHVKKTHPGKWVCCCSYAGYSLMPDKVRLSDNLAVTICRVLPEGIKEPAYKAFYQQEIRGWAKAVKRWYIWEYFDHIQGHVGEAPNFPGIFLHAIAEDIAFLKENGCRGMFNELSSIGSCVPNYVQDHLNVYVQYQLLNDSSLDVNRMLDEYCTAFYGPARDPMKKFYASLEERFTNPDNWKLGPEDTDPNWDKICPPSELSKFEALINQAGNLALEEPYCSRVRLIKEAVYGMMAKNCGKHVALMKGVDRKRTVPRVESPQGLTESKSHIEKFLTINGEPSGTKTEVWLGHNADNLFVVVKCHENDMASLLATVKPADQDKARIPEDDAVELFLDVGKARKSYYQVLGNSNGAIRVGKYEQPGEGDFSSVSKATCAVEKATDSWTITFNIPLRELTEGKGGKAGDVWGLNICRDRPRKGVLRQEIWTCWCPTGSGFHEPAKFGTITFE